MPKASYIISCTRPQFMNERIVSCLIQSEMDIEILVGDFNNSFEGCPDSRVREVETKGMPLSDTLNLLTQEARSDCILLANDDDYDISNRVAVTLEGLKQADIFCASYNRVDINGYLIDSVVIENQWDYSKYLLGNLNMPLCSGGWRKSTAPKWSSKVKHLSDYSFFIDAQAKGLKILTSPVIVTNIRNWDGQLSIQMDKDPSIKIAEEEIIEKEFGVKVCR